MFRAIFLMVSMLAVTGCASSGSYAATANAEVEDENTICRQERVLGSNIPRMVCRSEEQIQAERRQSQREMRRIQDRPVASGGN